MGRVRVLGAVAGVLLALGVGCSSEGGGSSGGPAGYAADYVDLLCTQVGPCCTEPGFSSSRCKQIFGALADQAGAANPANYDYDQAAADLCLEQTRAALADCSGTSGEACERVYVGKLGPDVACVSDIECAGDLDCDNGRCAGSLETSGVAGDSCYWSCQRLGTSGYSCSGAGPTKDDTLPRCFAEDGLYCSADGLCTELVTIGGQCSYDGECVLDAHCDTGLCAAKVGAGSACTNDPACQDGLYCKNQVCVAELPAGSPCVQFEDECADGSCDGGVCVANGGGGDIGVSLVCGFGTP